MFIKLFLYFSAEVPTIGYSLSTITAKKVSLSVTKGPEEHSK